jgi:hypothetical protein
MNTRLFLGAFAKLVFPHLNEYSPVHFRRNSVVVLDNARIHVAALVALRVLCALKGAKVVCLPPVSASPNTGPMRLQFPHDTNHSTHQSRVGLALTEYERHRNAVGGCSTRPT